MVFASLVLGLLSWQAKRDREENMGQTWFLRGSNEKKSAGSCESQGQFGKLGAHNTGTNSGLTGDGVAVDKRFFEILLNYTLQAIMFLET